MGAVLVQWWLASHASSRDPSREATLHTPAPKHLIHTTQPLSSSPPVTTTPSKPLVMQELYALKPWVKVILARPPLATQAEAQAFENWVNSVPDAHIKEWKAQPGNYHLMTKQGTIIV